jgi:uncharacterized OB-fold protein
MSKLEDYVRIGNIGTVDAFTVCKQDSDGKDLPTPATVALVRFPSAHGGLVHKVKGEVAIGDKVRVVFKEKSKRTGSILDIEHFEKIT